ncbi:MAG: hypothetical protein KIH62_004855 [Candidatus Kerfeldbacteria bacterium]|nr:hypothetical protein [Candidatus Kerfeldbacteria bacterium]
MFQTSVDLMYGALTIAIIVFTFFLVWIMYYIVQILKQGNEVITDIRTKIAEFERSINSIREKVVSSASSITFIAQEIGSVVEMVKRHSNKKTKK